MSVRIDVRTSGDQALVTVRGVIDRTVPEASAGLVGLGRGSRAVVVDLRDAVLASPHGVQALVATVREHAGTEDVALVCDRLPGRRLLRLACGSAGVRVLDEMPTPPPAARAGNSVPEAV
jgi:hypothetical protein